MFFYFPYSYLFLIFKLLLIQPFLINQFMYYFTYQPTYSVENFNTCVVETQPLVGYYYPPCLIPINYGITSFNNYQIVTNQFIQKESLINLNSNFIQQDSFSGKKQDKITRNQQYISKQNDGTISNKKQKRKPKIRIVEDQDSQEESWREEDSRPESKYDHFRKNYFGKKKIYKQNPSRNIMTNIGNQLITFIGSIKKSKNQLQCILKNTTQIQIKQFYQNIGKLKKQTDYYLNISKIKKFWFEAQNQNQGRIKTIIRCLSRYYLRWVLPLSILTSKKMSGNSRMYHLKARKQLLQCLKRQNE